MLNHKMVEIFLETNWSTWTNLSLNLVMGALNAKPCFLLWGLGAVRKFKKYGRWQLHLFSYATTFLVAINIGVWTRLTDVASHAKLNQFMALWSSHGQNDNSSLAWGIAIRTVCKNILQCESCESNAVSRSSNVGQSVTTLVHKTCINGRATEYLAEIIIQASTD